MHVRVEHAVQTAEGGPLVGVHWHACTRLVIAFKCGDYENMFRRFMVSSLAEHKLPSLARTARPRNCCAK